jgi:hypothetical protein
MLFSETELRPLAGLGMIRLALALAAMTAVLLVAPAAWAEDTECSVSTELIKSHVDIGAPSVGRVIATRYKGAGKRHLEQIFNLRGGITVSFEIMGCTHLGFSYSFRPVANATAEAPPKTLIATARELLDAVPLNTDGEVWAKSMKKALRSATLEQETAPLPQGLSFPCGDIESCEITVPRPRIITVGWTISP